MTNIIFFGTPEFASIVLEQLIDSGFFNVKAVVCQPDKPVGRKQDLVAPAVKKLALTKGIDVLQPNKIDDEFVHTLSEYDVDCVIVVAYGLIIPQKALGIWPDKWINVHPSLLPLYRGASPIQAAILNGDSKTGVSIMVMDQKMDHGPVVAQQEINVNDKTVDELLDELAIVGANLLISNVASFLNGDFEACDQNHEEVTFCKLIKKEDGLIDWNKTSDEIFNMWRAYTPWPSVYAEISGKKIKFLELKKSDVKSENLGIFIVKDKKLYVCASDGCLEVVSLQPEGKKVMDAVSYINGYLS